MGEEVTEEQGRNIIKAFAATSSASEPERSLFSGGAKDLVRL
jgi:hypothetical protein